MGAEVWGESQAHAWVALGKFCLVDEATAKKNVPLFVQELGRATNPAVRFPTSQSSSAELVQSLCDDEQSLPGRWMLLHAWPSIPQNPLDHHCM